MLLLLFLPPLTSDVVTINQARTYLRLLCALLLLGSNSDTGLEESSLP